MIGGGLLGLEAAYGLAKAGAPVTLVHLMDRLMERQLDAPAAALLKRLVQEKGIDVRLNASTKAIFGRGRRSQGIELADGSRDRRRRGDLRRRHSSQRRARAKRPASPSTAASSSTIGWQRTSDGVYALGECAEHRGVCYGLVEPAYEQAKVLADSLAGRCGVVSRAACSRPT